MEKVKAETKNEEELRNIVETVKVEGVNRMMDEHEEIEKNVIDEAT